MLFFLSLGDSDSGGHADHRLGYPPIFSRFAGQYSTV